jgi:hypothetical protein
MAIATTAKEIHFPSNIQLQTTYKRDNNLLFPTCYKNFIQKQQFGARRITKSNVPTTSNNKYCSLYLKA